MSNTFVGNIVQTEKYKNKEGEEVKKFNKAGAILLGDNGEYKILILGVWFNVVKPRRDFKTDDFSFIGDIVKITKYEKDGEEKEFSTNIGQLLKRNNDGSLVVRFMGLSFLNVYSNNKKNEKDKKEEPVNTKEEIETPGEDFSVKDDSEDLPF